jgi:hypothetical protein
VCSLEDIDALEVRDLGTADDFVTALVPTNVTWRTDQWAFRGVGDASVDLVPSVLRVEGDKKARWWNPELDELRTPTVGVVENEETRAFKRLKGETGLVIRFLNLADRVGLAFPRIARSGVRGEAWRRW